MFFWVDPIVGHLGIVALAYLGNFQDYCIQTVKFYVIIYPWQPVIPTIDARGTTGLDQAFLRLGHWDYSKKQRRYETVISGRTVRIS